MELIKSKVKTQCVHDVNAKGLYHKNMIKIEQDHDKDTYSKLVLNKLKTMWILPLFIFIRHLTQGTFSKNFQLTCDLCSPVCDPCATMCSPCPSMWEQIVNYELTKSELKFCYELIKNN